MIFQRYAKEGDLVVDPMCGSGTTIDVAKELNRKVIGYDLNIIRPDIIKKYSRKILLKDNTVDFEQICKSNKRPMTAKKAALYLLRRKTGLANANYSA